MSEPTNYQLKHPVKIFFNKGKPDQREEDLTSVTIQRPKAKDLRIADAAGGEVDKSIKLAARLCNLEIYQIEELDALDFSAISDIVEGFIEPGQPTGRTLSET